MGSIRLAVMPHWRAEVRDVAATIADASRTRPDGAITTGGLGSALLRAVAGRTNGVVVLCSDTQDPRLARPLIRRGGPPVFRLWWNTADEIESFVEGSRRGLDPTREHHVCFFPEPLQELEHLRLDLMYVHYAFSPPAAEPPTGATEGVWYAGEVDITDDCFTKLGLGSAEVKELSDRSWQLTESVVNGELTMVEAGERTRTHAGAPSTRRTLLWSVRNRVRYRLVVAVAKAFPNRVTLRGNDWTRVGLDALPTSFKRDARSAAYRSHRVALDLGSKSSNALLTPRVADILAAGGGLAQFDSGQRGEPETPLVRQRRAATAQGLVEVVDRLLTAPATTVAHENRATHEWYAQIRLDAGAQLVGAISAAGRS